MALNPRLLYFHLSSCWITEVCNHAWLLACFLLSFLLSLYLFLLFLSFFQRVLFYIVLVDPKLTDLEQLSSFLSPPKYWIFFFSDRVSRCSPGCPRTRRSSHLCLCLPSPTAFNALVNTQHCHFCHQGQSGGNAV